MYKSLIILKYLGKRRIAWVSLVGVALCTAMVIVVISVMGGWLEMFRTAFHGASGDIVVSRPGLVGFGNYDAMLSDIRGLKDVEAAAPLLRSYGLLNLVDQRIEGVQVVGMDLAEMVKVNQFDHSLWRQYQEPVAQGKTPPTPSFDLIKGFDYKRWRSGDKRAAERPGMIVGAPLIDVRKDKDGNRLTNYSDAFPEWSIWGKLQVVPIRTAAAQSTDLEPVSQVYWVVDDSRTQLWQLDANTIYVPFDVLQRDLRMGPQEVELIQADGSRKKEIEPGRTHEIQIKIRPGSDRLAVIGQVRAIVDDRATSRAVGDSIRVETWEKSQEQWLSAVENEKVLVTFLFSLVSLVAIFLIFCILYMIVIEKTRDIGIIKSVGATSGGVAAIFLGYGAAIGIVGAGAGLLVAFLIVHYINGIHRLLGVVLKVQIWKPEVYSFDKIPNTLDPLTVAVIVAAAILSAVIGALVPAIKAASLNPVESLRFE